MYHLYANIEEEQFEIENRNGFVVAVHPTPNPKPDFESVMIDEENRRTWDTLEELVNCANRGRKGY